MKYAKDITGEVFGKLTVVRQMPFTVGDRYTKWECLCECGNTKIVSRNLLTEGKTTSCGCLEKGVWNRTHGMTRTKIYQTWLNMRNRCNRPGSRCWENYGGRGISVCQEWQKSFVSFYEWALNSGYKDELSLDRIDVNGNYSPENCRWITNAEQQRNKSNSIHVSYNGQDRGLRELCLEIGFPYKTAHRRYTNAKAKGREITNEYLFAPIQKEKISKRYRPG